MSDGRLETFEDLLKDIEESYADDVRVKLLLTLTAKAAYIMGEKGL